MDITCKVGGFATRERFKHFRSSSREIYVWNVYMWSSSCEIYVWNVYMWSSSCEIYVWNVYMWSSSREIYVWNVYVVFQSWNLCMKRIYVWNVYMSNIFYENVFLRSKIELFHSGSKCELQSGGGYGKTSELLCNESWRINTCNMGDRHGGAKTSELLCSELWRMNTGNVDDSAIYLCIESYRTPTVGWLHCGEHCMSMFTNINLGKGLVFWFLWMNHCTIQWLFATIWNVAGVSKAQALNKPWCTLSPPGKEQ